MNKMRPNPLPRLAEALKRQNSIEYLDGLFSEFIRKRAIKRSGGCDRCEHPKFDIQKENGEIYPAWRQLQCAHLISRWHKSIRFDEDAAAGCCGGCHMLIDREADEKAVMLNKFLTETQILLLKSRARTPARYLDRAAIKLYFTEKLKKLNEALK